MKSLSGARVVLTGGCGFIGSHLVGGLLKCGVSSIALVDDPQTSAATIRDRLIENSRVQFFAGALESMSLAAWRPVLSGADFVVHLAARKHKTGMDQPDQLIQSNIVGTTRLLRAATRASLRRMVFSSSLYVYGNMNGDHFSESDATAPRTLYGASKLLGETLFSQAEHEKKVPADVLRLFFVYGPRLHDSQMYPSVIHENFKRIARGEPPRIYGDGRQRLDYVYVDDVVSAIVTALLRDQPGDIFNIGSGEPVSIQELTGRMLLAAKSALRPIFMPPDHTEGSCRGASIVKAAAGLGWRPRVGLDEGLRRTWQSIRREN